MTAATLRGDPDNAFYALATKARNTSSPRLVAVEAVGLAGAIAIVTWLPQRLHYALPFLCLAAFGFWGVIDHVLDEGRRTLSSVAWRSLTALQVAIAAAGLASAAAIVFFLVGVMIGVFIS